MFFNFFKQPSIREYEHVNIYYDPDKEAMQERRKRIREQLKADNSNLSPRIVRKGFLTEQRKTKSADMKSRNIRLAVFAAVIIALVYWISK